MQRHVWINTTLYKDTARRKEEGSAQDGKLVDTPSHAYLWHTTW